jgi:hypothetical protein
MVWHLSSSTLSVRLALGWMLRISHPGAEGGRYHTSLYSFKPSSTSALSTLIRASNTGRNRRQFSIAIMGLKEAHRLSCFSIFSSPTETYFICILVLRHCHRCAIWDIECIQLAGRRMAGAARAGVGKLNSLCPLLASVMWIYMSSYGYDMGSKGFRMWISGTTTSISFHEAQLYIVVERIFLPSPSDLRDGHLASRRLEANDAIMSQ